MQAGGQHRAVPAVLPGHIQGELVQQVKGLPVNFDLQFSAVVIAGEQQAELVAFEHETGCIPCTFRVARAAVKGTGVGVIQPASLEENARIGAVVAAFVHDLKFIVEDDRVQVVDRSAGVHQTHFMGSSGQFIAFPRFLPYQGCGVLVDRVHQRIVNVDFHIPAVGIAGIKQAQLGTHKGKIDRVPDRFQIVCIVFFISRIVSLCSLHKD